jgi:STE24 endopeptidase
MQLVLILAVLAALVVSDCGPPEPVSGVGWRVAVAGGGVVLVGLLAWLPSVAIARRIRADFAGHRQLLRRFARLRQVHAAVWLLSCGGISYGLDWARLVRFNWGLDHTFLADELLILAPVLVPLVLAWAAFYEVEKAVQPGRVGASEGDSPIFAARELRQSPGEVSGRSEGGSPVFARRKSGQSPAFPTRQQYLLLQVRHYLGLLLVPLLGLLAVEDVLELVFPGAALRAYGAAVLLACLAAMFVLFPVVLRYVWQTRPLPPGPLRSRLETAADRVGFRAREILVWQTNAMVVNAAVAGLVRRLRYVFLSDALLARLGEEEIEAVFGHEVGHVRHHHLLLRMLAMVAPLSLWMLLGQAFPGAFERLLGLPGGAAFAMGGLGVQVPTGLVLLGAMAAYVVVVFGYYSRQLEHQADLFGCRWAAADPRQPALETFASALEKLASSSGAGRNARSWQHASIARRIDFLGQLCHDPKRELRFQRRVRLLGGMLIGTVLSPLAYQLLLG